MSPLHHAIVAGKAQVVETLIGEFGADPRRALRIYDYGYDGKRKAKSAVMNLTLAMHLKGDQIIKMVETLLRAGASTAQSTKIDRITAFQYFVGYAARDVLEKIFEFDAPGAISVINHAAGGTQGYRQPFTTPLLVAMLSSLDKAKLLLEKGAHVNITLGDTLKYLRPAERNALKDLKPELILLKNCAQPLEVALRSNMAIDWVETLLKAGANVNTAFSMTWQMEENRYRFNFGMYGAGSDSMKLPLHGYTALTFANEVIDKCNEALDEKLLKSDSKERGEYESAKPLRIPDESVLDQFEEGSWKREVATRQFKKHVSAIRAANKKIQEDKKDSAEMKLNRKKEAVRRELEKWNAMKQLLLEHGAKTYEEAFPVDDRETEEQPKRVPFGNNSRYYYDPHQHLRKFHPNHHIRAPAGTGNLNAGYFKLYEAIWRGRKEDHETIRALCSGPTGEGEDRIPPLRMAVQDQDNFSPLALALYRKHYDMIDMILEIVNEQYEPADKKPLFGNIPTYREESDSDSDDVESEAGAINEDDFAVQDAEPVVTHVKCDVSPFVSHSFLCRKSCANYELQGILEECLHQG